MVWSPSCLHGIAFGSLLCAGMRHAEILSDNATHAAPAYVHPGLRETPASGDHHTTLAEEDAKIYTVEALLSVIAQRCDIL